jgi:hypothetical protein
MPLPGPDTLIARLACAAVAGVFLALGLALGSPEDDD